MKKWLRLLWDDFVDDIIFAYLPLASLVIFALIATAFWPNYTIISIALYIIAMFAFICIVHKKYPNLNPFRKNRK